MARSFSIEAVSYYMVYTVRWREMNAQKIEYSKKWTVEGESE
ncbi:hypothetical protein [Paenibacillus silvae]|nr:MULTISPECIES: hypothetical protein [Paenibacillus]